MRPMGKNSPFWGNLFKISGKSYLKEKGNERSLRISTATCLSFKGVKIVYKKLDNFCFETKIIVYQMKRLKKQSVFKNNKRYVFVWSTAIKISGVQMIFSKSGSKQLHVVLRFWWYHNRWIMDPSSRTLWDFAIAVCKGISRTGCGVTI